MFPDLEQESATPGDRVQRYSHLRIRVDSAFSGFRTGTPGILHCVLFSFRIGMPGCKSGNCVLACRLSAKVRLYGHLSHLHAFRKNT
jgi:hypothetical protein